MHQHDSYKGGGGGGIHPFHLPWIRACIKDLYFSDSREIKTANTYLFNFPVHLDPSNRNNFSFYYVFKHNTGTNNVMTIAIHWGKNGNNSEFHFYIHISKSQIKISINPLINESHLSLINIPNKALGKRNFVLDLGARYNFSFFQY